MLFLRSKDGGKVDVMVYNVGLLFGCFLNLRDNF